MTLSRGAREFLKLLHWYERKHGTIQQPRSRFAQHRKCTEQSIKRYTAELICAGLLRTYQHGRRANIYEITQLQCTQSVRVRNVPDCVPDSRVMANVPDCVPDCVPDSSAAYNNARASVSSLSSFSTTINLTVVAREAGNGVVFSETQNAQKSTQTGGAPLGVVAGDSGLPINGRGSVGIPPSARSSYDLALPLASAGRSLGRLARAGVAQAVSVRRASSPDVRASHPAVAGKREDAELRQPVEARHSAPRVQAAMRGPGNGSRKRIATERAETRQDALPLEPAGNIPPPGIQTHPATPCANGAHSTPGRQESFESAFVAAEKSRLTAGYADLLERWQPFARLNIDLGAQLWEAHVHAGRITAENIEQVFAGLERWKLSKQWARGKVHSVATWLGWSKDGLPAFPRWNDYPEVDDESV